MAYNIDYQRLRMLINHSLKKHGKSFDGLYQSIDMSPAGYSRMFRAGEMKLSVFLKIAEYCELELSEVFGYQTKEKLLKVEILMLKAQIEVLKKELHAEVMGHDYQPEAEFHEDEQGLEMPDGA